MKLFTVAATFYAAPDRHRDRREFLAYLRQFGRAERASETHYLLLSDVSPVDLVLAVISAPQLRPDDYCECNEAPGVFAIRGEETAAADLLLEAERLGIIVFVRRSPAMVRVMLYGSAIAATMAEGAEPSWMDGIGMQSTLSQALLQENGSRVGRTLPGAL